MKGFENDTREIITAVKCFIKFKNTVWLRLTGATALIIMTFSIMTLGIMTFFIMTLGIMTFNITIDKNDPQHNGFPLLINECFYARHYCAGSVTYQLHLSV